MADAPLDTPPPLPKADPETLVLRGSPRRVTRFRRGVIIAAAALGSTAIAGVTWFALRPPSFAVSPTSAQPPDLGARQPPDALAGAPKSYGDVPKLGPPLPGDLGKPILDRQRELAMAEEGDGAAAERAAQAAEAERQRVAAELQAARQSGVMIASAKSGAASSQPPAGTAPPVSDPTARTPVPEQAGADVNPHRVVGVPSPYVLSAGSVIAASLITGLNSDIPGIVTAQVTQNAFDSPTGRTLLLPQGSRLIGRYDNVVAFGQTRALVVWQRILLPDGSSIRIDNWPVSDTAGYSGLADRLDLHTFQLLKGVGLATLLGVGTEIGFASESDLVEAIRESAQQNGARAGDRLVQKNLDVPPTIRVRPGWPLRVVVHKDLVLRPWKGA